MGNKENLDSKTCFEGEVGEVGEVGEEEDGVCECSAGFGGRVKGMGRNTQQDLLEPGEQLLYSEVGLMTST